MQKKKAFWATWRPQPTFSLRDRGNFIRFEKPKISGRRRAAVFSLGHLIVDAMGEQILNPATF